MGGVLRLFGTARKLCRLKEGDGMALNNTPARITPKRYQCSRCGHIETQQTNHYGETYSLGHFATCPKCPPFAKYPEYGGYTVWKCLDKPTEQERT